jgi:hypothetical protein
MKFTGDSAILGRPAGYLDCAAGLDSYPDKVFLRDRLYDHNHIVSLSGRYAIPNTPVSVGLSYTFSYTYWKPNRMRSAGPGPHSPEHPGTRNRNLSPRGRPMEGSDL